MLQKGVGNLAANGSGLLSRYTEELRPRRKGVHFPVLLHSVQTGRDVKADFSLPSSSVLQNGGTATPLPHTPSWHSS
jgi:hypothetical protein